MNWIWIGNMLGLFEMRSNLRKRKYHDHIQEAFRMERLEWIAYAIDKNAGMVGISEITGLLQRLDEEDLKK